MSLCSRCQAYQSFLSFHHICNVDYKSLTELQDIEHSQERMDIPRDIRVLWRLSRTYCKAILRVGIMEQQQARQLMRWY
ncbi:unnamed protein product [Peronospora belbahrii]|uniref:Uncharacterized protein n=1 Tax=Peronospora belbahrii TaxID=622444 RepID=A0ABN8D0T3_9STRA|nr:unnamed protein product [Peronospora belbahrii]